MLTQNEETDTYEEYPLAMTYNPNLSTVILVHENECSFSIGRSFSRIYETNLYSFRIAVRN